MRILIALFGFLALALAPLATPAAAAAAARPCSAEMTSEHGDHGQMPADHETKGLADLCCVAMASAIPLPSTATIELPTTKSPLVASPITKLSGIQPTAADPPPRA